MGGGKEEGEVSMIGCWSSSAVGAMGLPLIFRCFRKFPERVTTLN